MEDLQKQMERNFIEHKEIVKGQSDILVEIAGLPDKILTRADERYASKELEILVKEIQQNRKENFNKILYIVLSAVVGGIVTLLIKRYI